MDFWYCQWELGFDIANENWIFDIANVNWAFDVANENWAFDDVANVKWAFDVANENWAFDVANMNWVLILPMWIRLLINKLSWVYTMSFNYGFEFHW